MSQQINGYALALYEIANETKSWKKFKQIAFQLKTVLEENLAIVVIFNKHESTIDEKDRLVKKIFAKYLPKIWLNFLTIIAYHHKFHLVVQILNKLILFINNYLKIKTGILYSVIKIQASEIKKISAKISKLMHLKVELINKLDASLIGGVKVVVDSDEFDDSLLSRLKVLKTNMINQGESNYGQ